MSKTHLTEQKFSDFALHPKVVEALEKKGFHNCTPIQALDLPLTLAGRDVAGQAQTGTGKTMAFLTSTFHYLLSHPAIADRKVNQPRALIMAPTRELAVQIHADAEPLAELTSCCSREELLALRAECRKVYVHPDLRDYITRLVHNTRSEAGTAPSGTSGESLSLRSVRMEEGVSPRGTLALVKASQGYAMLQGRDFVTPEDIQAVAIPTLAHRCLSAGISSMREKEERILSVLLNTEVPTENWKR